MTVYFTKEQPKLTEAVYLRMNETQKKTIAREAKAARLRAFGVDANEAV